MIAHDAWCCSRRRLGVSAALTAALEELLEAAVSAHTILSNDDTSEVKTQAHAAVVLARDLHASANRDEAMAILHTMNNKLAGVLAFALLAAEELGAFDSRASEALASVVKLARATADQVKSLSSALAEEPKR
jgi:hypothetical protein